MDDHLVHRYDLFMQAMETADPLRPVRDAIGAALRRGGTVWFAGRPRLLPPGGSLPELPPVAVRPGGDWPSSRYAYEWRVQADEFLHAHATQSAPMDVPADRPVSNFENQELHRFTGWREDPP